MTFPNRRTILAAENGARRRRGGEKTANEPASEREIVVSLWACEIWRRITNEVLSEGDQPEIREDSKETSPSIYIYVCLSLQRSYGAHNFLLNGKNTNEMSTRTREFSCYGNREYDTRVSEKRWETIRETEMEKEK